MKKLLVSSLLFFVLIFFVWQNNNNPSLVISRLLKKGKASGELKYRLYLLGIIPVGEAVFSPAKEEMYKGNRVFHLSATARPLKIYSVLFSGHASIESYVDAKTFSPLLFKQKVKSPGKEKPEKEICYDHSKGIMTLGGVERHILPNTHDPLSAVFNLRHMDLSKVKDIEMNINTNQKNYILSGAVRERSISINNQPRKIAIIDAGIRRRDKDPYHKSNVTFIFLEGDENIPVLIRVFASGALMTAKLAD